MSRLPAELFYELSINKLARSCDKNGQSMSSRREELEKRNCKFSPCFESSALRPIKSGWKNVQRLLHWIFNARCVIGLSVRMWFAKIIDRTKEKEMVGFWCRFCRWIFDYERLNLAHRLIIN